MQDGLWREKTKILRLPKLEFDTKHKARIFILYGGQLLSFELKF